MLLAFKRVCKYEGEVSVDLLALEPVPLNLSKAVCLICGAKGVMARWQDCYERNFTWEDGGEVINRLISIDCLYCRSCKHSHALLPLAVTPYLSYSVTFIAKLILDWLERRWLVIEALCEHYKISVKTFWRLRRRFSVCAVLAYGLTSPKRGMKAAASVITSEDIDGIDALLSGFFDSAGRAFCQYCPP